MNQSGWWGKRRRVIVEQSNGLYLTFHYDVIEYAHIRDTVPLVRMRVGCGAESFRYVDLLAR